MLYRDSVHIYRMTNSAPFKLTLADVRQAGLQPGDVGLWCFMERGCYHLFESETQAKRAYDLMLKGELVR